MFVFRGYALVCAKYQNDFNLQYLFAMISNYTLFYENIPTGITCTIHIKYRDNYEK